MEAMKTAKRNTRLACRAVLVGIAALNGSVADACGDKLLAVGHGLRFQRDGAAQQINLVIYAPGTPRGASLSRPTLHDALKRTVQSLQLIRDVSQLDTVLRSGQVDVMLVEFGDLSGITRELQSASSKPVILPVLAKPTRAEFAAVRRDYQFALRSSADELEYLAAIGEAMKFRRKSGARI